MPGINFICALNKDLGSKRKASQQVLKTMLYEEDYFSEVLLDDQVYILSCVKYEKYPVTCFENDEFFICLEGKIYSEKKDFLKEGLIRFAQVLFSDRKDIKEFLADWLLNTDGEFVIFMLHKPTRRIVIINDVFSRLPTYFYQKDDYLIMSRDYHFVSTLIDDKSFDRMSIAQYLLFGFCLDSRTYLEGVGRAAPSTLLRIDLEKGFFQKDVVHIFNFEIKENKNKSVKENARTLVPFYIEACKNRVDPNIPTVVSLSGGLDSRSVASGLNSAGIKFETVSHLDYRHAHILDVNTAQQVAKVLGVEWEKYQLKPGYGKDTLKSLKIKSGLLFLGRPQAIPFLERLKGKYGSGATFFSGNGGDRVGHDIRPHVKIKSVDELIGFILKGGPNATGLSIKEVSTLTQLSEDEIVSELRQYFASYPEKDFGQKNVHFNIYGQSFNWHHVGDDRKRSFLWSTSPFWSVKVFNYLMNCPDDQKKNMYLYTTFLSMLSAKAIKVPYAGNKARKTVSVLKKKYALWQRLYRISKWPNPIRFVFKKAKILIKKPDTTIQQYNHSPDVINCIKRQISNCDKITECFSKTALDQIINNSKDYNNNIIGCLFTVVSSIEYITSGQSSIKDYKDSIMESHNWLPKKR